MKRNVPAQTALLGGNIRALVTGVFPLRLLFLLLCARRVRRIVHLVKSISALVNLRPKISDIMNSTQKYR